MRDAVISSIDAFEILDSRGSPTIQVKVGLEGGASASASVPSGASTGEHEAHELRDHDAARYAGRGVLRAVANVRDVIAPALRGSSIFDQASIDHRMIELDGSPNKERLGANAILGVSMAVARAAAVASGLPLYRYLSGPGAARLPMPMLNIINGGKHAENGIAFQEFMIVPVGATTFTEAIRYGVETYAALRSLLRRKGLSTGIGDEGGFAPRLGGNEDACSLIVEAIDAAGYAPGVDVAIALDPAASSFFADGAYRLGAAADSATASGDLARVYADWVVRFPIVSIEDGFDENDWPAFAAQTAAIGAKVQIVGDDLYVTNPRFIERGIVERSTNAVLIKLNQIGTVTETIAAIDLCRKAGWRWVVSHRSGETDDTFIADFAVAMGGGQIKAGAPCRGERTAKYNRLLAIERTLGDAAIFGNPFPRCRT